MDEELVVGVAELEPALGEHERGAVAPRLAAEVGELVKRLGAARAALVGVEVEADRRLRVLLGGDHRHLERGVEDLLVPAAKLHAALAAPAYPNFIGAQDKAREASVKANMRTAQIAAESFATDAGGTYPATASDAGYATYFPGGSSSQGSGGTAGNYPVNPFTNGTQTPSTGTVTNVQTTRAAAPASLGSAGSNLLQRSCIGRWQHVIRNPGRRQSRQRAGRNICRYNASSVKSVNQQGIPESRTARELLQSQRLLLRQRLLCTSVLPGSHGSKWSARSACPPVSIKWNSQSC